MCAKLIACSSLCDVILYFWRQIQNNLFTQPGPIYKRVRFHGSWAFHCSCFHAAQISHIGLHLLTRKVFSTVRSTQPFESPYQRKEAANRTLYAFRQKTRRVALLLSQLLPMCQPRIRHTASVSTAGLHDRDVFPPASHISRVYHQTNRATAGRKAIRNVVTLILLFFSFFIINLY